MVAQGWNPSAQEEQTEGSEVQGHPELHRDFKTSLRQEWEKVTEWE